MDKTDLIKKTETLGALETSILSANMKYFKGNSETHYYLESEESVLYDTVVRYFTGNS
jgi:hypothetical protein